MKLIARFAAALATPIPTYAVDYRAARLSDDKAELLIARSDGTETRAPKLDDQDEFSSPKVSSDGRYVGWLAEYPDRGASYSQPLHLVVVNRANRLYRFSGGFGMVFSWCFQPKLKAVVYAVSYPHGPSPVEFEMRRIDDERVLARYLIPDDELETNRLVKNAPAWVRCIPDWQTR